MSRAKELHRHIRIRIQLALGGRSWNWLSQKTGIPQSTLASQAGKPRFSVDVLVLVAEALDRDVGYFLPASEHETLRRTAAEDVLKQIATILRAAATDPD